jgi:hypothetical protein
MFAPAPSSILFSLLSPHATKLDYGNIVVPTHMNFLLLDFLD